MGKSDYFNPGSHNVICDVCGFKWKRGDVKYRWDGLLTCPWCWETRHPQDFVTGVADDMSVPDVRGEGIDNFINTSDYCDPGYAETGYFLGE